MSIEFLGVDDVIRIHADQIARYGGKGGVRDLALLESAVASPQASFGGEYVHPTLPEMAAAYLFHLAQNHPFIDGNKRAAAAATFLFLYLNDLVLECSEDELVELTMAIASGTRSKADAAVFIAAHAQPLVD
jgi:death-on-curing protein